jgi:predicted ArsR family transcriptional regulator
MMKNPQKLLDALASKPMTKWELKQITGIDYPRVHEAISLLEKEGYAKALDTITSKRGRDMKLYGLDIQGRNRISLLNFYSRTTGKRKTKP